jgi:hypothetical protein
MDMLTFKQFMHQYNEAPAATTRMPHTSGNVAPSTIGTYDIGAGSPQLLGARRRSAFYADPSNPDASSPSQMIIVLTQILSNLKADVDTYQIVAFDPAKDHKYKVVYSVTDLTRKQFRENELSFLMTPTIFLGNRACMQEGQGIPGESLVDFLKSHNQLEHLDAFLSGQISYRQLGVPDELMTPVTGYWFDALAVNEIPDALQRIGGRQLRNQAVANLAGLVTNTIMNQAVQGRIDDPALHTFKPLG